MRLFPLANLSMFDRQVISVGIQPWSLLKDYDFSEDAAQAAEKTEKMFEGGGSGWSAEQLDRAALSLTKLVEFLDLLSVGVADPKWVEQTENAISAGLSPMVLNPEKAVQRICGIRRRQARSAFQALALVQTLQHQMAAATAFCASLPNSEDDGDGDTTS